MPEGLSQLANSVSTISPEFWIALIAASITIFGWYRARKTQIETDRRRFRTAYLIEVSTDLADGVNRNMSLAANRPLALAVESAISKIQFLGTESQIDLVKKTKDSLDAGDFPKAQCSMEQLLKLVRDELREEFDRAPIGTRFMFHRFFP